MKTIVCWWFQIIKRGGKNFASGDEKDPEPTKIKIQKKLWYENITITTTKMSNWRRD